MNKLSARQTVAAFLDAWKEQNYEQMYAHSQLTWKEIHLEDELESLFETKIKSYKINSVTSGVMITDVEVKIAAEKKKHSLKIRLLCETAPYKPSASGTWGVNPISVLRGL